MLERTRFFMAAGLAATALMAGCVSTATIPVSQRTATDMRDQSLGRVVRAAPSFAAMTMGKMMFGLIGAAAMIAEGNKIIADNKVEDPAGVIAADLSSSLSQKHGATAAGTNVTIDTDDVARIVQAAPGARFIVDVQTVNWSMVYFPVQVTKYRVTYSAKARLVDAQTKAVVAESFCKYLPEDVNTAPGYDELLANEAALLKAQLALGAKACIDQLRTALVPA